MLLFWALGGLRDESRHGKKTKKFSKKLIQILIVNISASKLIIEKIFTRFEEICCPIILKEFDYF